MLLIAVSTRLLDERIDCNAPDGYFEVRAVIPGGEYENIALLQSGIMMCGWTTNRFLITHNPQPGPGHESRLLSEGRSRARIDGQCSRRGRYVAA